MSFPSILSKTKCIFPSTSDASLEPNGLLAIGGDLSPERLITAYRLGIFPWYQSPSPILWWTPNPRAVLFPNELRITRSMKKIMRNNRYTVFLNKDFPAVIEQCAQIREGTEGTWLGHEMRDAYKQLHNIGYAHCVSVYDTADNLLAGLYGIALGRIFFGESMFTVEPNMSKVAFIELVNVLTESKFELIDCQVETNHLTSLGARTISRIEFERILYNSIPKGETPKLSNLDINLRRLN